MSCKWTTHGIKHSLSMHQINSEYDERDPCLARIKKSFVRGGGGGSNTDNVSFLLFF